MARKGIIWFSVFIALLLILPFFWRNYNGLVKREEAVNMSWSQVENQYQRRADLIMNLVETVKGYTAHEQETFRQVVEARAKATQLTMNAENLSAESLQQFDNTQSELSQALSRLFMVVENYPDLKASENFVMLQAQIEGSENRIAVERKRFNEAVNTYNTFRRQFPRNIVAILFGFEKKEYFGAGADAKTVPDINFSHTFRNDRNIDNTVKHKQR